MSKGRNHINVFGIKKIKGEYAKMVIKRKEVRKSKHRTELRSRTGTGGGPVMPVPQKAARQPVQGGAVSMSNVADSP